MANRYRDWLRQAEADMRHARNACDSGDYDWSCFASQQAGEKAIKALYNFLGMSVWGHTLTILLGNLPETVSLPEGVVRCAKVLDKHYIPTRYPNGFESGAPTDFYTEGEALYAIKCAEEILEFCRRQTDRS